MNRKVEYVRNEIALESISLDLLGLGYEILREPQKNGDNGVDILARNNHGLIHIEVIGRKHMGSARAKDFFEVFFRAVSRLEEQSVRCVIALPREWEAGLSMRAKQTYKTAWERLGIAFPELEIWLINVSTNTHEETKWNDWLRR
jgi:hypothetical protein